MDKYYHFTSYDNLGSINEFGLVPKSGGRTRSIGDNRCAVFLSQGVENAILMYGSMLYYYNRHSGDLGIKSIRYYKDRINQYNKIAQRIPLDEEDIAEVEAMKKAIECVKDIMEYDDFFQYIGDGVYLSISDIDNVNLINPKDCYTTESIPAEEIKVVLLRNKETGEIIDSRDSVLAYFMSLTPKESIINNTLNVVTKKIVEDLYESKADDIRYYNIDNFDLEEISIRKYFSTNKSVEDSNRKK